MIAVDESIIIYSLRTALTTSNDDETNYICNRISEVSAQMQKPLLNWLIQEIVDWILRNKEAGYIKTAPIYRLKCVLEDKLKEYK
jgi:hypothetical protein